MLFQKFQSGLYSSCAGHFFFRPLTLPVAVMLCYGDTSLIEGMAFLRHVHRDIVRHKAVALLSTEALPGVIAVMIGAATVFPIVRMVCTQMGIDALRTQDFDTRTIKRFQRTPASMKKVMLSGM